MPPETQSQLSAGNESKAVRMAEIELRRSELRRKMEEASKARKAKKGFMTADRKKKLRLLLRKKAAEELKREQERKAEERRWIIDERCGEPEDLEWSSKEDIRDICEEYFQRIIEIESEKWDIEFQMRKKASEIAELNCRVNDLRGKFQRPILKKVSRYENKFSLLQRKAAEYNIKNQLVLRNVRKPDFSLKDSYKDTDDWRSIISSRDSRESVERDIRQEDFIEVEVGEIPEEADKEESIVSEHEKDDVKNTESVEEEYRPELDIDNKEEVCEEEDGLHTNEEEILEKQPEGDERIGESHLEVPEEETGVEGEQRLGGQSLEDGEVQPSELPPTPPPQHTEEDLWHYLKEAVTSEHPSTVEEFLHNLIGTLQHVPEEYFQPVIEANIKRVNSPTLSTDGEHLRSLEEPVDKQEAVPLEGAQDSARDPEVPVVDEALPEASPQFTEESTSGDADGYSAVEGAFLAAGFWAVWVMCSLWGT